MILAVFAAAALLDVVTMLALPPGAELNPIAATAPLTAVVLKVIVVGAVAALIYRHRIHRGVAYIGAVAYAFGAFTNLGAM